MRSSVKMCNSLDVMKVWGPVLPSAGLCFKYPEKVEQKLETTSYFYIGASNIKSYKKRFLKNKNNTFIKFIIFKASALWADAFSRDVCLYIYIYISVCPLFMSFFLGLSFALRSHDQFKASDWLTLIHYQN